MNQDPSDKILNNMVAFIEQHGREEVERIKKSMGDEFTIEKNAYVDEEKSKIAQSFQNELVNQEVRMKIDKSKEQNAQRIERMKKVNEYVDQLRKETKQKIRQQMANDKKAYKQLLKDLLVQGLIKLMEGQVFIRCRQADQQLIEEVKEEAVKQYKIMIVTQVKRFKGVNSSDIPCNIIIDDKYLQSIEENENTGCLGGFKLFAKKGRIVCSQTIDDRIELCFQAAIPAIRHMLFPSMRKEKKEQAPVVISHHH